MGRALDPVAEVLSDGRHDAAGLAWASLRYQHVAALRSRLAETCAPATENLRLAAVRGVLREGSAWASSEPRTTTAPSMSSA